MANTEAMGISLDVEIAVTGGEGSLGDEDIVGILPDDGHDHLSEDEIEELKERNA